MPAAPLEARFERGFAAEERGEIAQAAALYEQNVADAEPGTILWCQSLYRRAYCLERLGSPDAEPTYLRLVERCPEDDHLLAESCFRLGWLREQAGDRDAAAGWYRRIAGCAGATPAARANGAFRLAFCLELGGRLADAIGSYEHLVDGPACADALRVEAAYRLAECLESVGLLAEARDRLRWIVEQAPEARAQLRELSRYRLGLLLMAMDDDAVLQLWADRDGLDAIEVGFARKAGLALGCYLQRTRRYDMADAVFRGVAADEERSPVGAEVLFRRMQCLRRLGRDLEAAQLLERLRNHPDLPPSVQARLDDERRPGPAHPRNQRWLARLCALASGARRRPRES